MQKHTYWPRLRAVLRLLCTLGWLVGSLWMMLGIAWGWRHLQQISITQIHLQGRHTLSASSILNQANLNPQSTWKHVSALNIAQALLQHPRIATAAVKRQVPDTLHVRIKERLASALVVGSDGSMGLVDADLRMLWLLPTALKKRLAQTTQQAACPRGKEAWMRLPRIRINTPLPSLGYLLNHDAASNALQLLRSLPLHITPTTPNPNQPWVQASCLYVDASQPYALWLYPQTGPVLRLPLGKEQLALHAYARCIRQGSNVCSNAKRLWFQADRYQSQVFIAIRP